jgi:hypothetical protein
LGGAEAVVGSVLGGTGFALRGAGAGGFLRIGAVGVELGVGRHAGLLARGMGDGREKGSLPTFRVHREFEKATIRIPIFKKTIEK